MKADLICSGVIKKTLKNILKKKGFNLDKRAELIFIQKGMNIPKREALYIVFDHNNLDKLIYFLDNIDLGLNGINGIVGKVGEDYRLIFFDSIAYFEADGNDVYCISTDGKKYKIKDKLYQLEKTLSREIFIRVSRSYIVNILNIVKICPYFKGKLLLKFDILEKEIVVTRGYSKEFKKFLGI